MRQRHPLTPPTATQPSAQLGAIACAVLVLCCAHPMATAQTSLPTAPVAPTVPTATPTSVQGDPLRLQTSPLLQEKFSDEVLRQQPTFVFGDRMTGRPDLETVIDGNAELRRSGAVIRADRIEYYQPDDEAKARGNVRINRDGNVYQGNEAQIKLESSEGFFIDPTYQFLKNGGHGEASRIDFIDNKRSIARDATYTTCTRRPGPSWMPDWVVKASQVSFDTENDVGVARDAQLRFKDVPILALPYLSFPLSDTRKSGWLPPALNIDNTSGVEVMAPYYWNIAPNRDATFFPSVATKRGLNVGGEFRYLEKDYAGTARLDLSPYDKLRGTSRWGLATSHSGTIDTGLASVGSLALNLSLNRVSDDNYWSDFPRATSTLTQRLLANDAGLSWSQGPFSLNTRVLKWQTLQVASAPIIPPYDRLPQVTGRYTRSNVAGLDISTELDFTQFRSQQALTLQPNAQRSYALAQVSRPWTAPGYFFTPKLQLHTTSYKFDSALANGDTRAQRVVPTASLDTGLIFERDTQYFGRKFSQTLEPRAFYTYTPFRDQSNLPNYDSGANDFNFATIYTENSFVGNDRFADNNLLTVGATSRLLDPNTGAEAARFAFAQRIRFSDQNVTLPGGTADTSRLSDMLFGTTINWSPAWSTDAIVQYNPKTRRSERSTLSARYTPSDYRVLSAAYRFTKDVSEQVDFGWQWPLNDLWGDKGKNLGPGAGQGEGRWYSVGRLNYSLQDRKIVDTVLGFEYDAGCWLGRVVFERLQTTTSTANKRLLFQLEFVGFARVGSNPLKALKDNVPRYQYLREKITTNPSRFSNYD
jgi:LPS-assembly protein